jgi:hypothetical protein
MRSVQSTAMVSGVEFSFPGFALLCNFDGDVFVQGNLLQLDLRPETIVPAF